jgi:hypothetical protein
MLKQVIWVTKFIGWFYTCIDHGNYPASNRKLLVQKISSPECSAKSKIKKRLSNPSKLQQNPNMWERL